MPWEYGNVKRDMKDTHRLPSERNTCIVLTAHCSNLSWQSNHIESIKKFQTDRIALWDIASHRAIIVNY